MRENMRTSWRQSGQKQDHFPSLLNHNAKYKRLLPPCCDFANGVPSFLIYRPGSACPSSGFWDSLGRELREGLAHLDALTAAGYPKRARAEAAIGRFKRVIGDGLRSRTDERQATEMNVAVHVLNRMLELGRPEAVRIA